MGLSRHLSLIGPRARRSFVIALLSTASACTALLGTFEVDDSQGPGDAAVLSDASTSTADGLLPDGATTADGGCAAGTEVCGTACKDLQSDDQNCGTCGTVCSPAQGRCFGGQCGGGELIRVAAGGSHTCALTARGFVYCWGNSAYGATGKGTNVTCDGVPCQPMPRRVEGVESASAIVAGQTASCVVADNNATVSCWGRNDATQLGHPVDAGGDQPCFNQLPCNPSPSIVPGVTSQRELGRALSTFFSFPNAVPGELWAWGSNDRGIGGTDIGLDDAGNGRAPAHKLPMPNGQPQVLTSVSGLRHACASIAPGDVYCWGRNVSGELGHGPGAQGDQSPTNEPYNRTPLRVNLDITGAQFNEVRQVAVTDGTSCAVKTNGTVWCWGYGGYGVTSIVVPNQWHAPRLVSGLSNVESIATSGASACARLNDDRVFCWGLNDGGQLGAGFVGRPADAGTSPCGQGLPCYPTPIEVPGLRARRLSGFGDHFAALGADGRIYAWGLNDRGQLGHAVGTRSDRPCVRGLPCSPVPEPVDGLPSR